jgi:hypothetical protein
MNSGFVYYNLSLNFKVIAANLISSNVCTITPEPKSCYDTVSVFYSARNTNWETTRELFFNFDREQFVTFACRKRPFHFNKRKKKDPYRRGITLFCEYYATNHIFLGNMPCFAN